MTRKQKKLAIRSAVAIVLTVIIAVLEHTNIIFNPITLIAYLVPYFTIGYDVLKKAGKGIIQGRVMDEKFLMAIATIGAIALGEYTEGVAVMIFYQLGELFESYAVGKSRKNIAELMDIRPDYANIEKDGALIQVDPNELSIGTIIVVNPGEKVPIDGEILEGTSSINTSALTGESLPRTVKQGDAIISGSINETRPIKIKTTKLFGESTASKILDLVENASSRKSKSENFITKFAKVYTPIVCGLALALAVIPPIYNVIVGNPANVSDWIYRALTCLVVSCPCAIVVSVPLSFFGGIGGASNAGILIKGSNYMETLSKIKTVAFDKTGTVTKGNFAVTNIHKETDQDILYYAAHAELSSSHPIAKALREAYKEEKKEEPQRERVTDTEEVAGHGIVATVDGHQVKVGNTKLIPDAKEADEAGTIIYVELDGQYAGFITIADEIKPTAKEAIKAIKEAGILKTVMLTGDRNKVATQVANELQIDEVHSDLLPADKVDQVESLLKEGNKLAFVGDGINDAPVLARADLGIAMGALGSDAAIEAADIVLMDDNPKNIAKAIRIAKKCMRIVYTNITFAIVVKVLCLVVASIGFLGAASMWLAIFGDVGVLILCILNAIRCLFVKNI